MIIPADIGVGENGRIMGEWAVFRMKIGC